MATPYNYNDKVRHELEDIGCTVIDFEELCNSQEYHTNSSYFTSYVRTDNDIVWTIKINNVIAQDFINHKRWLEQINDELQNARSVISGYEHMAEKYRDSSEQLTGILKQNPELHKQYLEFQTMLKLAGFQGDLIQRKTSIDTDYNI
jgi:vacuolar-type H+-ATPase subunit I/STV1